MMIERTKVVAILDENLRDAEASYQRIAELAAAGNPQEHQRIVKIMAPDIERLRETHRAARAKLMGEE